MVDVEVVVEVVVWVVEVEVDVVEVEVEVVLVEVDVVEVEVVVWKVACSESGLLSVIVLDVEVPEYEPPPVPVQYWKT